MSNKENNSTTEQIDVQKLIESFQPFMDMFGNLILGGIGVFEKCGTEIFPLYISEGAMTMLYGTPNFDVEKSRISLRYITPEKDYEHLLRVINDAIANKCIIDCTLNYQLNSKVGYVWIRGSFMKEVDNKQYFVGLIQDVSNRKNLEKELAIQFERYRLLEETSNEILFEIDLKKDTMNYSFKEMDGEFIRKRISHYSQNMKAHPMVHPDFAEELAKHFAKAKKEKTSGSFDYLSNISGHGYEWHHISYNSIAAQNGEIERIVGRIRNIHDKKIAHREASRSKPAIQQVYHGIKDKIKMAIDRAELETEHTLVMISINHFKHIIKANGVACGDVVLHHLTNIIDIKIGSQCIFGQIEDGKTLLYMKNAKEEEIDAVVCEIIKEMAEVEYQVEGLAPKCSAGVVTRQGAVDFEQFLQEVEEALHLAKIKKGQQFIRV